MSHLRWRLCVKFRTRRRTQHRHVAVGIVFHPAPFWTHLQTESVTHVVLKQNIHCDGVENESVVAAKHLQTPRRESQPGTVPAATASRDNASLHVLQRGGWPGNPVAKGSVDERRRSTWLERLARQCHAIVAAGDYTHRVHIEEGHECALAYVHSHARTPTQTVGWASTMARRLKLPPQRVALYSLRFWTRSLRNVYRPM